MELPECPVCLQTYDGDTTIPRVLSCGHSTCEICLVQLPQKHPQTIRCPACTQLVKLPYPQGPSALPKNIDLLRFSLSLPNPKSNNRLQPVPEVIKLRQFVPNVWSDEFYLVWKDRILPADAVSMETTSEKADEEDTNGGNCGLLLANYVKGDKKVSLFRVTSCSLYVKDDDDGMFHYSYVARIMELLSRMKEQERDELSLILEVCSGNNRICEAFGLWYNTDNRCVYLVCEKKCSISSSLEKLVGSGNKSSGSVEDGLLDDLRSDDGVLGLVMICMEICEGVICLHSEGLFIGSLGLSCVVFDDFGHVHVDMNEILTMGRKVRRLISKGFDGEKETNKERIRFTYGDALKSNTFVSPELLFKLLHNTVVESDESVEYSVGYSSDVWSLACILLRLMTGEEFTQELPNYLQNHLSQNDEEHSLDFVISCKDKIHSRFNKFCSNSVTMSNTLCQCLSFDPASRPSVNDVWKSIRELLVIPKADILVTLKERIEMKSNGYCLLVGELCKLPAEINEASNGKMVDEESGAVHDQMEEMGLDNNVVDGVSGGHIKFKPMQGHLDCITGLAVGGGFLFSSSFDKTVKVWSLKDYNLVHSFKGHEHRVMAVVFVDGERPLCISGDSGGGIFIWGISVPFEEEPLKKCDEEKDWRYSGIHALTVSGSEFLYSGSGDKLIKAWSLRDYTLSCTMSGHKSTVSALAICNGVLYSGSWDGTIRLWSLNDHSPLTVLGEDTLGNVCSVLSLSVNQNMLVAGYDSGCIKIWRDDVFRRSIQAHEGAVLALCMEGKWLYSGGWDKTINVQELSGDEFQFDPRPVGSISTDSVIPALSYWQGKLISGCADKNIKVRLIFRFVRVSEPRLIVTK